MCYVHSPILQVEQNDELPKSICKSCATKLDEFYSYRETCLQTELVLLRCLSNSKTTQPAAVKVSSSIHLSACIRFQLSLLRSCF